MDNRKAVPGSGLRSVVRDNARVAPFFSLSCPHCAAYETSWEG